MLFVASFVLRNAALSSSSVPLIPSVGQQHKEEKARDNCAYDLPVTNSQTDLSDP
jgi:hypothetical protein